MAILLSAFTIHAVAEDNVKVLLNGVELSFDVHPQLIDGRTMVPMRRIFEALGAEVDWDGETQTVTALRDGTVIIMQIDNVVISVDGENITLDVPPQIVSGRTLVPVRAVAESLDANVDWDSNARAVVITHELTPASTDITYGDVGGWEAQYFQTIWSYDTPRVSSVSVVSSINELIQHLANHFPVGYDSMTFISSDVGFITALFRYDTDNFFEDRYLALMLLSEPSGSIRHRVESVSKNGDIIISRLIPEMGTADMAAWLIILELDNSFKPEQFRVELVDVPLDGSLQENTEVITRRAGAENYGYITIPSTWVSANATLERDGYSSVGFASPDGVITHLIYFGGVSPMTPQELAIAVAGDQRSRGAINVEVKETKVSDIDGYVVESFHQASNIKVLTYLFLNQNGGMQSISIEGRPDRVAEAREIVEKTFSLTN